MYGRVVREFGVKSRSQNARLLHQGGLARVFGKHFHIGTDALENWSANKNHLHRLRLQLGGSADHIAVHLPPVPVAQHGHVQQAERFLPRILHFRGEQNRAGTSAQNGFVLSRRFIDRVVQTLSLQELQLRGSLAARQNQTVAARKVLARAHFHGFDAHSRQHRRMRRKISLHCQNPNLHCMDSVNHIADYQPRVESKSFSSSWRTSRPRMASPNSSCASNTAFGSSKCVVAFTTAFARASGSLDLKIPEPTNTASAPRRRTNAASAGVAIPPAEKFGTGNLPVFEICRISSSGAPSSLAACISSSSRSVVSFFIWLTMVRMCRTASTTLPEPASALVRIMAAPSAIRRSASPRLRAPQTNGTRKSCFQTWFSSSAGVSTSLSSMKSTSSACKTSASIKWPMRTLAITGMVTVFMISRMILMEAMRATPPSLRMSEGTRSSAITAQAPAFSAICACSALVTSIITPPLSISAKPTFTRHSLVVLPLLPLPFTFFASISLLLSRNAL